MTQTVTIPSHARRLAWRPALLALIALCLFAGNVAAAGAIQDDGKMFSQSAQTDFANRSAQIERDTGKSLVVRTVASLGGKDISAQADAAFAQLNVNGMLIYLAKNEKKSTIKVGTTTRQAISLQEEGQIRDGLDASFARGDFDGGLLNTTDRIGRDFRAVFTGTTANRGGTANQPAPTTTSGAQRQNNGIGLGAILGILFLIGAIVVVGRFIMRRGSGGGNTYTGNNYGGGGGNYAPGPPPGPGYGGNYGGYGQQPPATGGGFGSSVAGGAVGGFGGAVLGNAVYDHFRDGERGRDGNYNNNNGPNGGGAYPGNNASNQDPNNDRGRVDDSYQDTGGWGGGDNSGAGSAESSAGTGSWGDSGGGGGGDSGSSGDSGGGSDSGGGGDFSA